jgi:predicted nucleic acid-binding protein
MRFLLDTNVLSEAARPRPEPRVLAWLGGQAGLELAVSVLTFGELQKGICALPEGARRRRLEEWLAVELPRQFSGRVLPVSVEVAREWGRLAAEGRRLGRALPVIDGLLLATASVHGLTLVTRNEVDCAGRGILVFNPWGAAGGK